MTVLIPAILLALAVVFFVLHPVVAGREAPMEREDEELSEAQHRKTVALLALRDVEYDYHAGKLDTEDYEALKRKISAEALDALDQEEAEWVARDAASRAAGEEASGMPEDLEAEIAALRAAIRDGVVCSHCGHPNPQGSRFCGDCGAALPKASDPVPEA